MWNYSFTLPSAMILLILVVFYFRRPRLPIRMNRTFLALLLIDALTLLADFASSRVDEVYTLYPISICYLANLAFSCSFLRASMCFSFSFSTFWKTTRPCPTGCAELPR